MPAKKGVKVIQIAEDLRMDPRDLLAFLKTKGIAARTTMSPISVDDAQRIKAELSKKPEPPKPGSAEAQAAKSEVPRRS